MDEIILDDGITVEDDAEVSGITENVNPETATDVETPADTVEVEPKVEKEEIDYEKRYADSTREFQRLQIKLKEGEALTARERQRAEDLQRERDDAFERLKAEQPETFDTLTIKKQLDSTTQQLAELKEKAQIDDFIAEEPLAKQHREALKNFGRAFPGKSLGDIWNENFKDIAEAQVALKEGKKSRTVASQPAKGGATAEPGKKTIGGYSEEEFNKLPVMKRRDILTKAGIQF